MAGTQYVGQDVHGGADRGEAQFDGHRSQLFHRAGSAHAAPSHEGDRLAIPFHVRVVERILEDARVAVVVLAGEDDVAVGGVDPAREVRDGGIGVLARVYSGARPSKLGRS